MSVYQLDIQLLILVFILENYIVINNNHLFQTAQGRTIIEILLK